MIKSLEEIMSMINRPNMNPLEQTCQRKFVRAICARWNPDRGANKFMIFYEATNQLDIHKGLCTGEQSKCGCMHAEPKIVLKLLQNGFYAKEFIMFCNYSPCDPCANLIGASELFKLVVWQNFAPNWPNAPKRLEAFGVKHLQIGEIALTPGSGDTVQELTKFLG